MPHNVRPMDPTATHLPPSMEGAVEASSHGAHGWIDGKVEVSIGWVICTFVSCNVMMVCLVRWFHGGVVKENGEFENMKDVTRMFEVAPCLHEIVEYARSHFSCGVDDEISLKGRVDCGRGRAAYALVDLKTDVEWDQFKRLVEQSSVPYLDVVVTSRKTTDREGGRELVAQLGTQESTILQLGIGVIQQEQLQSKGTEFVDDSNSETFSFDETEPGTTHDYFPNDVFEREEAEEDDDDDISEGSDGGDDNDEYESEGEERVRRTCRRMALKLNCVTANPVDPARGPGGLADSQPTPVHSAPGGSSAMAGPSSSHGAGKAPASPQASDEDVPGDDSEDSAAPGFADQFIVTQHMDDAPPYTQTQGESSQMNMIQTQRESS
ncbi:hypothetical protein HU200_067647 [Digitaria exilis]|uniref:Uncharacterized protein n=1 Tax=Digitaria exilis TaxID=1010633 RepID=A0A834ZZH3_9POAL|nr:hypothetical protein HU200_067647 [Digitaria exilis]